MEVSQGTDGSRLVTRRWRPSGDSRGWMVVVHGLSEHGGRYRHLGVRLAERGYEVVVPDLWGHGLAGGPRGDVDRFRRFLDQLEAVLTATGRRPVVLLGHSLGGLIALDYALDDRFRADGVVLVAPAVGVSVPAWKRALARAAGRLAPRVRIPNTIRGEQLSRDPAVGERYLADPLVGRTTSARLGSEMLAAMARVRERAGRLAVPTLVLQGGADPLVPPEQTAWLASLSGVERIVYPRLRHEILNEPEWEQVVEDLLGWWETR